MEQISKSASPAGPVVLCILDGWGEREAAADNAISLAETPTYDRLRATCPTGLIDASAKAVGLPDGQMGNSEVGHMNIGAGQVVMQDLPRIDVALATGALAANDQLQTFAARIAAAGGRCHLLGLVSPGGVHSHQDHIVALAQILSAAGVEVCVHAVLDGRDTAPRAADEDLRRFAEDLGDSGRIVTLMGRFFALDRDQRWDRVERAYQVIRSGIGQAAEDLETALNAARDRDENDEFVTPTAFADYAGMADGDGLFMANFRADRAREILTALVDPDFAGFDTGKLPHFSDRLGMISYSSALDKWFPALFQPIDLTYTLGEVAANAGKRQLRIAETEKYPHVTFFLNGGREQEFPGESRILVPSPTVKTYDLQPEMSAAQVCDHLVTAIASGDFDLIICNFANPDMVGHTGVLSAAIKAVQTVDQCLHRIETAIRASNGCLMITADHGNIEQMTDPETVGPHTSHTTNLVPAVLVNGPAEVTQLRSGRLSDIAPTLLTLMGLVPPAVMTGRSLLVDDPHAVVTSAAQ